MQLFPLSSKYKTHMHVWTTEYKFYNFPDSTYELMLSYLHLK